MYVPPNDHCIDKRLFTQQLSPDERAKHAYYSQRHQDEVKNGFSERLTNSQKLSALLELTRLEVGKERGWGKVEERGSKNENAKGRWIHRELILIKEYLPIFV